MFLLRGKVFILRLEQEIALSIILRTLIPTYLSTGDDVQPSHVG